MFFLLITQQYQDICNTGAVLSFCFFVFFLYVLSYVVKINSSFWRFLFFLGSRDATAEVLALLAAVPRRCIGQRRTAPSRMRRLEVLG